MPISSPYRHRETAGTSFRRAIRPSRRKRAPLGKPAKSSSLCNGRPCSMPASVPSSGRAEAAALEAAAREQPDCRIALRDRHAEHTEAGAQVARAEGLVQQAAELVADLRRRHAEAAAALAAGDQQATERLVEAITTNAPRDGWPFSPRADSALTKQAELAGKLRTAEAARDRFEGELQAAKSDEERSRRALELAAPQVLVNAGTDIERDIRQAEAELARRRAGLMDLRTLLDREQRRLAPNSSDDEGSGPAGVRHPRRGRPGHRLARHLRGAEK
jgi:hypothetical protein